MTPSRITPRPGSAGNPIRLTRADARLADWIDITSRVPPVVPGRLEDEREVQPRLSTLAMTLTTCVLGLLIIAAFGFLLAWLLK